jgi:LPXTG-site transpeptidase (sortase) family protein
VHRSVIGLVAVALLTAGVLLVAQAPPQLAMVGPLASASPTPVRPSAPSPTTSVPATSATTSPTVTATSTVTPAPTVGPIAVGYRVQVPRLGIDLPIAEGDIERDAVNQQTPERFAFHYPGTAIPGTGSNSYLYAHARRGMFLALWNARVGDEVIVLTPTGAVLRYVVSEVHPRVSWQDNAWVQPTSTERLTLQTSTGPNRDDPRFVVIAIP